MIADGVIEARPGDDDPGAIALMHKLARPRAASAGPRQHGAEVVGERRAGPADAHAGGAGGLDDDRTVRRQR
jgi:hypothetical protein